MNVIGYIGAWLNAKKQYPNGSSFTGRERVTCLAVALVGILLCMLGLYAAINALVDIAAAVGSSS